MLYLARQFISLFEETQKSNSNRKFKASNEIKKTVEYILYVTLHYLKIKKLRKPTNNKKNIYTLIQAFIITFKVVTFYIHIAITMTLPLMLEIG